MENLIFEDENHKYQFDFSMAIWASDEIHHMFQDNGAQILSDVDFVAETEDSMIFVEYKNANIAGAAKPESFKPSSDKALNKIAYKYYDSWIYLKAIGKKKPIEYVYILEYPNGDSVSRKMIREKIVNLLLFQLQKQPHIVNKLITSFSVLSIDEWNRNIKYKDFPISEIIT